MPTPSRDKAQEQLGDAWGGLIEYVAYELNKEGCEGAVLARLAPTPFAAFDLAWGEMNAEDPYCRCIGAAIPGYVPGMDPETLGWIWNAVIEGREQAAGDEFDIAMSNAIAERVVQSAIRWLRVATQREAGIEVLRDMIEKAIEGTDWNDSHFAAAALMDEKIDGARELAGRYRKSKAGKNYAEFLDRLLAGDPEILMQGRALADDQAWRAFKLPAKVEKQVQKLQQACAMWEPFAREDAMEGGEDER